MSRRVGFMIARRPIASDILRRGTTVVSPWYFCEKSLVMSWPKNDGISPSRQSAVARERTSRSRYLFRRRESASPPPLSFPPRGRARRGRLSGVREEPPPSEQAPGARTWLGATKGRVEVDLRDEEVRDVEEQPHALERQVGLERPSIHWTPSTRRAGAREGGRGGGGEDGGGGGR